MEDAAGPAGRSPGSVLHFRIEGGHKFQEFRQLFRFATADLLGQVVVVPVEHGLYFIVQALAIGAQFNRQFSSSRSRPRMPLWRAIANC